jgi:hypothetical protein
VQELATKGGRSSYPTNDDTIVSIGGKSRKRKEENEKNGIGQEDLNKRQEKEK